MIILLSCLVLILFLIALKLNALIDDQERVLMRAVERLDNHIRYSELDGSYKVGGSQ